MYNVTMIEGRMMRQSQTFLTKQEACDWSNEQLMGYACDKPLEEILEREEGCLANPEDDFPMASLFDESFDVYVSEVRMPEMEIVGNECTYEQDMTALGLNPKKDGVIQILKTLLGSENMARKIRHLLQIAGFVEDGEEIFDCNDFKKDGLTTKDFMAIGSYLRYEGTTGEDELNAIEAVLGETEFQARCPD